MRFNRACSIVAIIAAILTTDASPLHGSVPIGQWIRQLGSSEPDSYPDVAVTDLGQVYIAGSTTGSLAGPADIYGDAFLAAYGSDGTLNWVRQFGISSTDGYAVAADSQGNVYVAGETTSTVGLNYDPGGQDAFVRKFDAHGNELWYRQLGTGAQEVAYDISIDDIGNIYIAGGATGDFAGPNAGFGFDAFVSKLSSNGTVEWTRQFGTPESEVIRNISADRFGNIYVSGQTHGDLGGTNSGHLDAFVSKFDSAGDLHWTRQIGSSTLDSSHGMTADGLGGVYVGGDTYGVLPGTNSPPGGAFIAHYDDHGNMTWVRQYASGSIVVGMAVGANGALYASGLTPTPSVSKVDANGNLQWTFPIGTEPDDGAISIKGLATSASNAIYVSGSTSGNLGGPNPGGLELGFADAYLLRIADVPEPPAIPVLAIAALIITPNLSRRFRR